MTTTAEAPAATTGNPQALVVVPFASRAEAEAFASQVAAFVPLVTEGTEQVWRDPATGADRQELCFTGGWRAKYAGSGEVVIARGGRRN